MGAYQSRHPACSFLRKKVTAREGGGCFVWAKDRWTLRAAETQKEGHLTDVLLFWKGRLKLIFPLNETAAQRCELALTYKKSEQAIQSLLRCGTSQHYRCLIIFLTQAKLLSDLLYSNSCGIICRFHRSYFSW